MGKYNEAMNHVVMSDDMKNRILSGVSTKLKARRKVKILRMASAVAAIAAVVVVTINLILLQKPINNPGNSVPSENESTDVSIGPDIQTFTSLQALADATGYPVKELSYLPFKATEKMYSAYENEATIRYYNNSDYDFLTYTMAKKAGDVSGFEWGFTFEKTIQINGRDVTIKGEGDTILVAYWSDDIYSKAISYEGGLTEQDLSKMIE